LLTAEDYETFVEGILCALLAEPSAWSSLTFKTSDETALRKKIAELQEYRMMGITTLVQAEKYEKDKHARVCLQILLLYQLSEPDTTRLRTLVQCR
jgi:transcriptional adapter 2-alpha